MRPRLGGRLKFMDAGDHGHAPVLFEEVLGLLDPQPGEIFLDCTIGRGGHAAGIAPRLGPRGLLLGLDLDPKNLAYARDRLAVTGTPCRFFQANFAELPEVLTAAGLGGVDMILADLGVSTNQLLTPDYGLSFTLDGPLDMRLDPRLRRTAADLVNTLAEQDLADLLFRHAQERHSRRIARAIVTARRRQRITTTFELAQLVRRAGGPVRHGPIDPATRTFQALRMAVNGELDNLRALLAAMVDRIKPGGRAAVVSFHSGEDRLVKQALRQWQSQGRCVVRTPRPVTPSEAELQRNHRCRSAKLRVARFGRPTEVTKEAGWEAGEREPEN